MKKSLLFLAIATLVSLGAQAIDKVTKNVVMATGEITSVEGLTTNKVYLLSADNTLLHQDKAGANSWDTYVSDIATVTSMSNPGAKVMLETATGGYFMHVFRVDGTAWTCWGDNNTGYLNAQPSGSTIFALKGPSGAPQNLGQDMENGAVWTVSYSEENGFAFKNVGRAIYLGWDASAARPSTDIKYWKAYKYMNNYTASEVATAYDAIKDAKMLASVKTALTAAKTAYDKNQTSDNLEALGDAVNAAIESNQKMSIAVNDDLTNFLSNPHFNTSDVSAWNMNGKASPSVDVTNHDCEFFQKDFDMSMTLTGMKKGTYEIGMQAFQRPGSASTAMAQAYDDNNWTSIATLYTTAMEVPVPNIMKEKQTTKVYDVEGWQADSKITYNGTDYYVPNSMAGAHAWFEAGYYNTTAKAVVTEDGGNLTFGFKGSNVTNGWILFDNFTLKYISETVMVDASESEKLINNVPTGKMGASAKSALDAAVSALKADKTNATLYNELKDAISTAEKSVAYYAVVTPYVTVYNNLDATSKAKVGWPANTILGSDYTNGSLDEKGFADPKAMINNWVLGELKKGVAAQTAPNSDMSLFITNANFEDGLTGWTNTGMGTQNNGALATADGGKIFAEKWQPNGTFSVEQTVTGLPAGTYKLTVYAMSRGTQEAYIYINGVKTDIEIADKQSDYSATVSINTGDELKVGSSCTGDGTTNSWYAVDYFRLNLVNLGVNRATATGKCGTICLPYAFSATGATIYSAAIKDDYVTLTEVTTPVAGTPYIYKATADAQSFTYASGDVVAAPVAAAPLTGVFAATPVPVGSYVMQTQQTQEGVQAVQAFYQVAEGQQPTLSANKAYLTVPESNNAKMITIGEDSEATAIKAIDALTTGNAKIYDLNGRELKSLQKGVNIVNGVKVYVK